MKHSYQVKGRRVIINPKQPVVLGSSGRPNSRTSMICSDIESNILMIKSGDSVLILISFDLLYVGSSLRKQIEEGLQPLVTPRALFLAASHTHTAPMTDLTKPLLGEASPSYIRDISASVIAATLQLASEPWQPAHALIGYSHHDLGVNRRRSRLVSIGRRGVTTRRTHLAPNYEGPNDGTIRQIQFRDMKGTLLAHVWSTALHPSAFPRNDCISPDFPGYVRDDVRLRAAKMHLPVIFLQGFSGNIRPCGPTSKNPVRRMLQGPTFVRFDPDKYSNWVSGLKRALRAATWTNMDRACLGTERVALDSSRFYSGVGRQDVAYIHGIRIGDVVLVGVPCEVVVEYSFASSQGNEIADHLWGVGCIDHVLGYVPTTNMLTEGGYEVDGFCKYFGVSSVLPTVESSLRTSMAEVVSRL